MAGYFLMICDDFFIVVVGVGDRRTINALFFRSLESLAPPILQSVRFFKFNHPILFLINRKNHLRCFKNALKRYKNAGWLPGNFFARPAIRVTKSAAYFPLGGLCG